jgi:hypothetical protein
VYTHFMYQVFQQLRSAESNTSVCTAHITFPVLSSMSYVIPCHFLPYPHNEDLINQRSWKKGNLLENRNYNRQKERLMRVSWQEGTALLRNATMSMICFGCYSTPTHSHDRVSWKERTALLRNAIMSMSLFRFL